MRLRHIAVAVAIALTGVASQAKTEALGALTAAGASFGNTLLGWGTFTDYYTFSLGNDSGAVGTTVTYDSILQDLTIKSVGIESFSNGWVGIGSKDYSANVFSFSGLGAGAYRLVVNGAVGFQIDLRDGFKPASYQGTIQSIASPAPEPGTLAMALVGLVGVSFAALRRKRS
jgi:hypothetical protein